MEDLSLLFGYATLARCEFDSEVEERCVVAVNLFPFHDLVEEVERSASLVADREHRQVHRFSIRLADVAQAAHAIGGRHVRIGLFVRFELEAAERVAIRDVAVATPPGYSESASRLSSSAFAARPR